MKVRIIYMWAGMSRPAIADWINSSDNGSITAAFIDPELKSITQSCVILERNEERKIQAVREYYRLPQYAPPSILESPCSSRP